jgi:hypothetical protein
MDSYAGEDRDGCDVHNKVEDRCTDKAVLYCRSAVESTLGSQASVALVVPNRNSRLGTFILCCADKQAQNLFENRDRFGK